MPITDSVASNVESSLSFNLASTLVKIFHQLEGSADGRTGQGNNYMLFLCTGIIVIANTPLITSKVVRRIRSNRTRSSSISGRGMHSEMPTSAAAAAAASSLVSGVTPVLSHVMLLATSKIFMEGFSMSRVQIDINTPPLVATFMMLRNVSEIVCIGVFLSCCLAILIPYLVRSLGGNADGTQGAYAPGDGAASGGNDCVESIKNMVTTGQKSIIPCTDESIAILRKQIRMVVINMQRAFADAVSGMVPYPQTRKMLILLGLCMLPSIARIASASSNDPLSAIDMAWVKRKLMMRGSGRRGQGRPVPSSHPWAVYMAVLSNIMAVGLSMAWINITLGIVMDATGGTASTSSIPFAVRPPTAMDGASRSVQIQQLQRWIPLVLTCCIALIVRVVSNIFSGFGVFQGYIEWNVSTIALDIINQSVGGETKGQILTVACTGVLFLTLDSYLDYMDQRERRSTLSRRSRAYSIAHTLQTFQSIAALMFSNSAVSYATSIVTFRKGSGRFGGGGGGSASGWTAWTHAFESIHTLFSGLVLAATFTSILGRCTRKSPPPTAR